MGRQCTPAIVDAIQRPRARVMAPVRRDGAGIASAADVMMAYDRPAVLSGFSDEMAYSFGIMLPKLSCGLSFMV